MGDVRPDLRVLTIDIKPLFDSRFSVRLYRIDWTFRLTNTAVDAFVGVDVEHRLPLIKALNRADHHTICILAPVTGLANNMSHFCRYLLPVAVASCYAGSTCEGRANSPHLAEM